MGRFITFEGGEGGGKSTQTRLLQDTLTSIGVKSILTREPGGSVGAEEIRELIVSGSSDRWDPLTELCLLYAARRDHWLKLIKPNIYVKGPDYVKTKDDKTKKIVLEKKLVKTFGGEIKYTEDQAYSSSSIINSTGLIYNIRNIKVIAWTTLIFGIILSIISITGLYYFSNFLSALLLFITIAFYVFVYTIWLKRKTPQNIVIGGAAGALRSGRSGGCGGRPA